MSRPLDLNPQITIADADSTKVTIKVQAVGDCKREAGAGRCSRFKSPTTKAKIKVETPR